MTDENKTEEKMPKRDSFEERRKLFKNIWDTAINIDDKEPEAVTKPKVIKTLRLGETDCINIGKNEKQRIRNLRTVCTRLLAFCDRQDRQEQMSSARQDSDINSAITQPSKAKKKRFRKKRKVHKTYSYVSTLPGRHPPFEMSFDSKEEGSSFTHRGTRPMRDTSSSRLNRADLIQQFLNERYNLNNDTTPFSPRPSEHETEGDVLHKVVKKKQRKRKRIAIPAPIPYVISFQNKNVSATKRKNL